MLYTLPNAEAEIFVADLYRTEHSLQLKVKLDPCIPIYLGSKTIAKVHNR